MFFYEKNEKKLVTKQVFLRLVLFIDLVLGFLRMKLNLRKFFLNPERSF